MNSSFMKAYWCSLLFTFFLFSSINMAVGQKYPKAKDLKGLDIHEDVLNFKASNQDAKSFDLYQALEKGPVLLIFYRGQWCPVCNRHLRKVQDSLSLLEEKGVTVIAVSPEKPDYLQQTIQKTNARFTLLYDEGYRIAEQFGVSFQPTAATRKLYNSMLGAKLKKAHSDKSERLPIPASYIIGQDRKVIWKHVNPDYKKRASIAEILNQLP